MQASTNFHFVRGIFIALFCLAMSKSLYGWILAVFSYQGLTLVDKCFSHVCLTRCLASLPWRKVEQAKLKALVEEKWNKS